MRNVNMRKSSAINLIFIVSSVISTLQASHELCPCMPFESCTNDHNQLNKEDRRYIETILKCTEVGFVRCCDLEFQEPIKRSDDIENFIFIDDVSNFITEESVAVETTTDATIPENSTNIFVIDDSTNQPTLLPSEEFTENPITESSSNTDTTQFDEIFTSTIEPEVPTTSNDLELPEIDRNGKFIDDHVWVVYPNLIEPDDDEGESKKKLLREHLFLIFPNGEIEAALAAQNQSLNDVKSPRRVIVRKRLLSKRPVVKEVSFEGAESMVSQAFVEAMDVEKVKTRLRQRLRNENDLAITTTTTENPIEETTRKRKKKIKKFRTTTTTAAPSSTISTLRLRQVKKKKKEGTVTTVLASARPIRKQIYDVSSRSNFLKKPAPLNEVEEPLNTSVEVMTSESIVDIDTTTPTLESTTPSELALLIIEMATSSSLVTTNSPPTSTTKIPLTTEEPRTPPRRAPATTPKPKKIKKPTKSPQFMRKINRLENEHQAMVETVQKTLTAIHKGANSTVVRSVMQGYEKKLEEIRKNPQTRVTTIPTRAFRGSVKYGLAARRPPHEPITTTHRNVLRSRSKGKTEIPRVIRTTRPPSVLRNLQLNTLEIPPTLNSPLDFNPSPLYGMTMDKFNDFDAEEIEKIHETFTAPPSIQNGFFPVLENGTPSIVPVN